MKTSELLERFPISQHVSPHASTTYGDTDMHASLKEKMQIPESSPSKNGLTFRQYMLAGSVAGVVEHTAMFPVDTLKTRLQMLSGPCGSVHSLSKAFSSLMRTEGPVGFYRGIGAMVLGAGPSHAVYFAVYEICKQKFGGNKQGHHPFAHMSAGACATLASDAVLNPMDVVKQRLQLGRTAYRGVFDCIRKTLHEEGLKAFYVSYRTTVLMNVPFVAAHFATYEAVKKTLKELSSTEVNEEHILTHVVAGGTAGAIASALTTPLDVVKTRLQCQGVGGAERFTTSSVREVAGKLVAQEGPSSLFKGLQPRVLFHAPAAAISWSTYEAAKSLLQRWNKENEA